jgi:hypothetical protein
MTVQITQEVIPPNGQKNLNPGKYFFCINAPVGGYAFQTWGKSGSETYGSSSSLIAPVGLKVARVKGWQSAIIFGVPGQTITYVYGDEVVAPQDITDILSQIATISGSVITILNPSGTVDAIAPLLTVVTAGAALFPVNAARRRITVYSDPNNPGNVYFMDPTLADKVGFIQPGTFQEFDTTAALGYADAAGGNTLYFLEEK